MSSKNGFKTYKAVNVFCWNIIENTMIDEEVKGVRNT